MTRITIILAYAVLLAGMAWANIPNDFGTVQQQIDDAYLDGLADGYEDCQAELKRQGS